MSQNQEPNFDSPLEEELRQVAAAKVDDQLFDRLEQTIADADNQSQPARPTLNWGLWLIPSATVAAVVLLIALSPSTAKREPAAQPAANPSNKELIELFPLHHNNMVNTHNEGIIHSTDNRPFQKISMLMVDSYTWEDPDGPTRVQFTVPREEHLLIPVDVH